MENINIGLQTDQSNEKLPNIYIFMILLLNETIESLAMQFTVIELKNI